MVADRQLADALVKSCAAEICVASAGDPSFNHGMAETPDAETPPPRQIDEHDGASLAAYLLGFDWEFRNNARHRQLVDGGLPLWREILRYVPNPMERGRALEIGSPPFHITLLLQKFRNYDLSLTGFATDGRPQIISHVENPEYGEQYTFTCDCFDAERERFPYDDASFDLVTWCEVIEHLTENPVHTLSEIHRVLKPGGALVISTPNASRADSIADLLYGENLYDPYHLGSPLKGSRHSREYTYKELRDLVAGCGYGVERMQDIDIYPPVSTPRRVFRAILNNGVSRVTHGHHRYHLFVRARKTARPFRLHFPTDLFEASHLAYYRSPRDAAVAMGENDEMHIGGGWADVMRGDAGVAWRRCDDRGDLYLFSDEARSRVRLVARGGGGRARVWHDNAGALVMLSELQFSAPAGAWTEIELPLNSDYQPGNPLHISLEAPGGLDVRSFRAD